MVGKIRPGGIGGLVTSSFVHALNDSSKQYQGGMMIPSCAPSRTTGLASEVDRLARLTLHIDRLSAMRPLSENAGLRAQMRRSAMDAISHAAWAAEAVSPGESRASLKRTLAALAELETFTRMAAASQVLTPQQASQVNLLVADTVRSLRAAMPSASGLAGEKPDHGQTIGLSGAA